MNREKIINEMIEKWPSSIVARTEVSRFSGGAINGRTVANLESKYKNGEYRGSLPEKLRIGGKVVYRAESLARWLVNRSTREDG